MVMKHGHETFATRIQNTPPIPLPNFDLFGVKLAEHFAIARPPTFEKSIVGSARVCMVMNRLVGMGLNTTGPTLGTTKLQSGGGALDGGS